MIRGYGHGAGRVVLGLPSGAIEPGESAVEAAARELLEETGYAGPELKSLDSSLVEPGRQHAVAHVVVERNARGVGEPRSDASERFELRLVESRHFLRTVLAAGAVSLAMVAAMSVAILGGEAATPRRPNE